jgi:actin-like ATPase involved in cell morphogenesis
MAYHLGVDLGTTFTAAALSRQGRAEPVTLGATSVAIPSVAYLAGNGEILFGQPAARRATTEPSRVAREFKRRLGDPTPLVLGGTPFPAEILMARLLDWVVQQVSTTEGSAPASIAVTHPANWGAYKLDLLGQAIRHVGLAVDHLVPEPVAAASFYASQRDLAPGEVVAVFDLGGGTFDAAVVRAERSGFSIAGQPDGIDRLGGIDFDHAVLRHVAESCGINLDTADAEDQTLVTALGQLRHQCVDAKEALSAETDAAIPVMLPNRHTEVRLTRGEFEAMIRPTLDETLVALRRTIASAELTPEDVTAVLLVGGSSRIPLVGQLVAASLDRPIAVDARPKDAIPLGAAITAANAAEANPPASRTDVAAVRPPASSPDPEPGPTEPAALTSTHKPQPPAASPRRRPVWWAAAAVAVVATSALGAALSNRDQGDRDDGQETVDSGESTTTSSAEASTDELALPDDLDVGALEDLLGGGLLDSGAGSDTEPPGPLPGSDWNADARAQFVEDCGSTSGGAVAQATGKDAEEVCGCTYDDIADSGTDFAEFNDVYVSEADPSDPITDQLIQATQSCIIS